MCLCEIDLFKLLFQAENVHSVYDALLRLNSSETVLDAEGGKVRRQSSTFIFFYFEPNQFLFSRKIDCDRIMKFYVYVYAL